MHIQEYQRLEELGIDLVPGKKHKLCFDVEFDCDQIYKFKHTFDQHFSSDYKLIKDEIDDNRYNTIRHATTDDMEFERTYGDGDWEISEQDIELVGVYDSATTGVQVRVYNVSVVWKFVSSKITSDPEHYVEAMYIVDRDNGNIDFYTETEGGATLLSAYEFFEADKDAMRKTLKRERMLNV